MANRTTVLVFDNVTYTYNITNIGPDNVTNLNLSDDIFGYIPIPPANSTLQPGEFVEVTYDYRTQEIDIPILVNIGNASGYRESGPFVYDEDMAGVTVNPAAAVAILKIPSKGVGAKIGEVINYTYQITNTGRTNVSNLQLTDKIYQLGGDVEVDLTSKLPKTEIAPGEQIFAYFDNAITEENLTKFLKNSVVYVGVRDAATIEGDDLNGELVQATAGSSVIVDYLPDIELVKEVNRSTVICGGPVTYTYNISNPTNITLYQITLVDDKLGNITLNGTNTAVPPAVGQYDGGDLDGDNVLDPNETWNFSVTGYYISFSMKNTGNATGRDKFDDLYWDTDDAQVNVTYLSINGTKFDDLNCNGAKDPGEPGLDNWTIVLSYANGSLIGATNTSIDGSYRFDPMCPGNYTVSEVLKSGWRQTYPPGDGNHSVNLTDSNITGIDFGNALLPCISGFKINYCNDSGIPGWTVILNNGTGEVDRTSTNATGWYSFCGLEPGDYWVCEDMKAGWTNVTDACINVTLVCDNVTDQNFTN
ncbi:MAG TPA: SdrD B-like domain-containing protein, partial [Methanothrix sp.]|nr:SdrD B-like domain-containing protein [Methanothrix sp.]